MLNLLLQFGKEKYQQSYETLLTDKIAVEQRLKDYRLAMDAAQRWLCHQEAYEKNHILTEKMMSEMIRQIKVFPKKRMELILDCQDACRKMVPSVGGWS